MREGERLSTCPLAPGGGPELAPPPLPTPRPLQGDSHKLDFRSDLLPCLPGPYGALPPGQELSHPASLFTATGESGQPSGARRGFTPAYRPVRSASPISHLSAPGAVHAAANPFTAAPGAHGPFLSPSTHIGKSRGHAGRARPPLPLTSSVQEGEGSQIREAAGLEGTPVPTCFVTLGKLL